MGTRGNGGSRLGIGVMIWIDVLSRHGEVASRSRIAADEARVGRAFDNDVVLDDPHVAPHHLRVFRGEDGELVAEDLGTVNGLYYAFDTFAAPDPHGPVIDGVDIFKDQFEKALGAVGIKVAWIEDWDLYHRLSGEVHCATNSKRALLPDEKWWTSSFAQAP